MRRTSAFSFGDHVDGNYDVAEQLRRQLIDRTREALGRGRTRKAQISTLEELAAHQERVADIARASVGDLPVDREPPATRCTGTIDRGDHLIDKLLLDCGDGHLITANLYRPAQSSSQQRPAVFMAPGHSPDGKAAPLYQQACVMLVRSGFVVITTDTLGQGERWDFLDEHGRAMVHHNVVQHDYMGTKVRWVGDSPARYFVADARRAIDYLLSRDDVDESRLGIMGNSGGGTMTTWLAMVEPRVAAAAMCCFISGIEEIQGSARSQDCEQIIVGGVAEGIDHDDFLMAMAPRPVIVGTKRSDFFPPEGTAHTIARARKVFDMAGVADHLQQVCDDGPHGLSPVINAGAAQFLARHLGATPIVDDPVAVPEPLEPGELWATETGQLGTSGFPVRTMAQNRQRLATASVPAVEESVAWLDDRVRAHRVPDLGLFPRWFDTGADGVRKLMWWPEVGITNTAIVFEVEQPEAVEILLLDKGTDSLSSQLSHARNQQLAGRTVIVADVRGTGGVTPREDTMRALEAHYGTMFRFVNELIALDDSLAAGQLFDVLRILDLVEDAEGLGLTDVPIELVGEGHGAFFALAAGALSDQFSTVRLLSDPFDPAAMVAQDLYGTERDFLLVMPGMAQHCPQENLRAALGDRLV